MAGETTITVIGNLVGDPELRFTPAGKAVSNFTVASTPRTFDRASNGWVDGETLFLRASVWNEQAENVAESLTKGMRVIVSGRLKSRSYETKEGEKRTVMELEVDEIGPSLRYANAKVVRTQRNGNQQQGNGNNYNAAQGGFGGGQQQPPQQGQWGGQQPPQQGQWGNQPQGQPQGQQPPAQQGQWGGQPQGQQHTHPQDDPWATPVISNAGGWGNGPDSEPPF